VVVVVDKLIYHALRPPTAKPSFITIILIIIIIIITIIIIMPLNQHTPLPSWKPSFKV